MRYRALTSTGDYSFGAGSQNFLVNSTQAVQQAVQTRLTLLAGEWFLDTTEGLDTSQIVGAGTQATRDLEVQSRILGTQGVLEITGYVSNFNPSNRQFTVAVQISTIYGTTTITQEL